MESAVKAYCVAFSIYVLWPHKIQTVVNYNYINQMLCFKKRMKHKIIPCYAINVINIFFSVVVKMYVSFKLFYKITIYLFRSQVRLLVWRKKIRKIFHDIFLFWQKWRVQRKKKFRKLDEIMWILKELCWISDSIWLCWFWVFLLEHR